MGTCIIDLSTQPDVGIDTLIFIPILINMNQIDNNNNNNNNNNDNSNFPVILKYRDDPAWYGQVLRADEALLSIGWQSSRDGVSIKIPVVV